MNETITHFITNQKIATVCCVDGNGLPYCFHCFYAFNEQEGLLYYKSSKEVYHTKLMLEKPPVAGTIQQDKLNTLAIQGIQFEGNLLPQDHALTKGASRRYHTRYPYALAMSGDVFTIQLSKIKMTDNSQGFGKKITWENTDPVR